MTIPSWTLGFLLTTTAVSLVTAQEIADGEQRQPPNDLVVMLAHELVNAPIVINDVTFSIEKHGEFLRFVATQTYESTTSNWYQDKADRPFVAFDTDLGKYIELENRVLFVLANNDDFEALVNEYEPIRSKNYETLGYAVFWLTKETNPISVRNRLQDDPRVLNAKVQAKPPRYFPQ